MNRTYALKVAAFLESLPEHRFNMMDWGSSRSPDDCQTIGCIAGAIVAMEGVERSEYTTSKAFGALKLELSMYEASALFVPSIPISYFDVTIEHAATILRRLAAHGGDINANVIHNYWWDTTATLPLRKDSNS